ncbi:MAG: DUF2889 domain-containing protein [Deltaproteobacteria bacterium]|nr:DUF2889 domain-containing protein [Deltaproteobacteria bacterium]
MTRLKDLAEKHSPVHERKIELHTYPINEDEVVVEGWLRDERLVKGYFWDGETRLPGVVHHIGVRLLVGGWPLRILDAEAEMRRVPQELCPTVLDTVKKVVGLTIESGFSGRVLELLGRVEGCTHMSYLVMAMGPAAVHGYWTHKSRKRRPAPRSMEEFPGLGALVNSCMLWREDGPLIQKIEDYFRQREADEEA